MPETSHSEEMVSTPPSKADEPNKATRIKLYDEQIRESLRSYKEQFDLSNTQIGQELGIHASAVSKYLSGKPDGDVKKLEEIILDVIQTAQIRRKIQTDLFKTNVTEEIHSYCEVIRKTNDFGLIHGEAGVGKTCGADLYQAGKPSAVKVTATAWRCGQHAMIKMIWDSLDTRKMSRKVKKSEALVTRFKGSNRPLLVDNAHRLTKGAIKYLFDFHDETGIPIILLGNPEVLDHIKANDQQFSRIGLCKEVKLTDYDTVLERMIEQHLPTNHHAKDALRGLGRQVLKEQGHARALRKQLYLANEIQQGTTFEAGTDEKGKLEKSFRAAHTRLIRNYYLD